MQLLKPYYSLLNNLRLTLIIGFVSLSLPTQAQLETTWWYFGMGAGLSFQTGTAVSDTNNPIMVGIGAGTQSNGEGELQFFFAFDTLINRNYEVLQNGTGLLPSYGSEQSTVVVPRPNREGQFYIFTTDFAGVYFSGQENGFFYHLVDMSLDNGLGGVVDSVKNIILMDDSTSEKIAAAPHANGVDYWVMIQQSGTNLYHAYLVTENGPMAAPVTSQFGLVANTYSLCEGGLRFNHTGNMLACMKAGTLEIFDFDPSTGLLSNPKLNISSSGGAMEFSPDDSKVYTFGPRQYDVTLPTGADIENSEVILAYGRMLGFQLALDGKIYGNSWLGTPTGYMAVINNPNEPGFACNFQDSAVYLDGRFGFTTVPNFMSSYFYTTFFADSACVGVPLDFEINFHFITNVQWNFGDPSSGAANTSILINPTHTFSTAGNYTVTLIAQNGVKSDTVIKTITVKDVPQIDLGPDRDLCLTNPDSVKLSLGGEKGVYQWSTGSADSTTFVTPTDVSSSLVENRLLVWLQFTNQCGTDTDTVLVYGSEPLSVNLVADTFLCADEFLVNPLIDTLTPIVKLLWQDSSVASTFIQLSESELENSHNIRLTASNACGSASDSLLLTFLAVPDGILPNDSLHCLDEGFYLVRPNRIGISYKWDDQTTDFQRYVSGTGTYGLTSYNQCDTLRDTFNVVFNGEPKAEFIDDTLVCPNETVVISNLQHQAGQTYVWSNGSTDSTLVFTPDSVGTTIISVRITLKQCSIEDSILLQLRGDCYDGCTPAFANIFTPNADGLNDRFSSGLNCETEHYHLSIYSRWGALVFESRHPNIAWDGSINGIPANNGVYYYVLNYQLKGQVLREYRGYVELVE